MVRPVSFGWLRKRWPALLAALCGVSILVLAWLGARPSRRGEEAHVAAHKTVVEGTGSLLLRVHAAPDCEGADAGSCEQTSAGDARAGAGSAGLALAGARVRVFAERANHYVPWTEALTDGAGRARITAPAGVLWVLIDAPGRARTSERLVLDGGSRDLQVQLGPAVPLRLQVHGDSGQPIADATVLVQGLDPLPHGALTSAEGWVSFANVGERIDSIRVHARGYDSALVEPASRELRVQLSTPARLSVKVIDGDQSVPDADVWVSGIDFWPPRQVKTAADGVAVLSELSHGTYDLRAQRGDRVSQVLVATTVERGERRDVTLELEAGRFIPVHVTDGASGDASPIAGAELVLVEEGLSPFPLQGRTGPDGRVSLGPVPVGGGALNVTADGFVPESGVAVPREGAAEIRVALLRGGRLVGQVVDTEGTPVEGARLEIVGSDVRGRPIARHSGSRDVPRGFFERSLGPAPPLVPMGELGVMGGPLPLPGMPPIGPPPSAAWASDLDGNYRLEDVPPGRVQILVRHPEFVASLSEAVTLAPGGEARVRVVLERGAALEGRLLDARGQPVKGARVDASARHGTEQQSALTGSDGRFAFGAVPLELDLFVARPEARHHFVLRQAFELTANETREVELVLPQERATVAIVVQSDDGEPIPDARVALLSLDPAIPLRQTSHTDVTGEGQIADAVGIHALLRVQAPGFRPLEVELDEAPSRVVVTLERGVTVTGRVTHVRGRQPVQGAEIVWARAGERRRASTDDEGEFQLVDVAPGAARVSISHPDFSTLESDIDVDRTGRADRVIEIGPFDLEGAGAVAGTVLDPSGAPVRGARVGVGLVPAFLPAGAPMPRGLVETDGAGRFELRGVRSGKITLSAYAAGVGRGSVDVQVVEGDTMSELVIPLVGAGEPPALGALANVAITLGERDREGYIEVVVVAVAEGSEAERAGLLAGDVLWSVDGADAEAMGDVRRRLGGNDGSDVIIEVERAGEPLSVRVRREAVR